MSDKCLRTIAVNQAGYSSGGDKLALFSGDISRHHVIDSIADQIRRRVHAVIQSD